MNEIKVKVNDLTLHYGTNPALKNISMEIPEKMVTAFIGPSGCGKSTFLQLTAKRVTKNPKPKILSILFIIKNFYILLILFVLNLS